mmetsp:Transcript_20173/g.65530  ORF Transcript_20173/g.65530 Transcript_20173/m.65530 type:complete len:281 (+) Transcript_20173:273-1115(+)
MRGRPHRLDDGRDHRVHTIRESKRREGRAEGAGVGSDKDVRRGVGWWVARCLRDDHRQERHIDADVKVGEHSHLRERCQEDVEPEQPAEQQRRASLVEPANTTGRDHLEQVNRGEQLVDGPHHHQRQVHLNHHKPAADEAKGAVPDVAVGPDVGTGRSGRSRGRTGHWDCGWAAAHGALHQQRGPRGQRSSDDDCGRVGRGSRRWQPTAAASRLLFEAFNCAGARQVQALAENHSGVAGHRSHHHEQRHTNPPGLTHAVGKLQKPRSDNHAEHVEGCARC